MPTLSQISYSRDACVAAVRDYYGFLTKMYLEESDVIEPPEEGWPNITADNLKGLGKTDEVISLLRHLPYIRVSNFIGKKAQGAAWCCFANWDTISREISVYQITGEDYKAISEDPNISEDVPSHVISLTCGAVNNPVFLLDTELGIINWYECPGEIYLDPSREPVLDDPYDWAPENEAEWRAGGAAWAVADFFEILKDQFRDLHFIPINSLLVVDIWTTLGVDTDGAAAILQDIYREHGWPDLERYRKRECLEAVQTALAPFRLHVFC